METMAKSLSQSLSQDVGASQFAVTSATRLIIAVRIGCSGRNWESERRETLCNYQYPVPAVAADPLVVAVAVVRCEIL